MPDDEALRAISRRSDERYQAIYQAHPGYFGGAYIQPSPALP